VPRFGGMADGGTRYANGDAPEGTPREKSRELSPGRWPIEQCHGECWSNLGLDHYEGRSWEGRHRHVMLVFVPHLFYGWQGISTWLMSASCLGRARWFTGR
jgi:SRSO17 transposase